MKLLRFFLISFTLVFSLQICFGQDIEETQPTENWLKQYTNYNEQFLYQRFDRYSKDDLIKFRAKFDLLNNSKSEDDWDRIYSVGSDEIVGFSQLRLKSGVGFVSFYVYTCFPELRHINYGRIVTSSETIQLLPEFGDNSPRKATPNTYVKVKWNNRYYLVEESSLSAFAQKAVGIYVEPEDSSDENYQKWSNYWVSGDFEKPLSGLPEFPLNYKKFQRSPIEAKIISVGKRVVEEKILGNINYSESAFYNVTIDVGKNNNVKEGMKFEIPEINAELFITRVNPKTSIGLIHRDINDTNKIDVCHNENFDEIPCPKIKALLKVKTRVGDF